MCRHCCCCCCCCRMSLRGMASKLWSSFTDAMESVGDSISSFIMKRYPDIDEVLDTLDQMKEQYHVSTIMEREDDEKWRPMLITLGLLYKLQRIQDSDPRSWYNKEHIFVHDDEREVRYMKTFGFYWHFCMKIAEALRSIDNKGTGHNMDEEGNLLPNEDTFNNVIATTGLKREDILFAHATDSLHVDQHCPDFAMVVLHDIKQILMVICGTRMIPAPKMRDVFMDLYAESIPFLHGEGHQGMVIGARNILMRTINKVGKTLAKHPGYNIMIVGYSLGAGICQLMAMELLEGESKQAIPEGTEIRSISFGAPPVFRATEGEYKCPNIFSVVYNNDGLASASVASVTKLFLQIRAVDHLQLRRRDMIKLLWSKIPTLDGGEIDEDNEDDDDDFVNKTGSQKKPAVLDDPDNQWIAIKSAVEAVNVSIPPLEHPAKELFLFKRKENDVITRLLDETIPLTSAMRLRAAMFSHHMPWSYNALFEGYGTNGPEDVDLSILPIQTYTEESSHESGNLYPDLSSASS